MHALLKITCLVLILTTLITSAGYCGQTETLEEHHPAASDPDNLPTRYDAFLGTLLNSEVAIKTVNSKKMQGKLLFADSTSVCILSQQQDTTLIPIDEIKNIKKITYKPAILGFMLTIGISAIVMGILLGGGDY